MKYICFVYFLLVSNCCEKIADHTYIIKVINQSNYDIAVSPGFGHDYQYSYPDTALSNLKPHFDFIVNNDFGYVQTGEKWESVFASLPAKILSLYVFNKDTLQTYEWNKIRSEYKVIKRYDLTYDYLQSHNWTITYP